MSSISWSLRIDEHLQVLWQALAARKKPGKPGAVRGLLLSENPAAFAIWDHVFKSTVRNRPDFWERWRNKPLLVVIMRTWVTDKSSGLDLWVRLLAEHKQRFPQHRIVMAMNTSTELPLCEEAGIEAVWCNHNAHVDERLYQPLAGAKAGDAREFDAIYDARFARYKRNDLAAKVKRLALIHYTAPPLFELLWTLKMRWMLRHGRILNRHRWGVWPVWMNRTAVAASYTRARVGLCLSPVEGAMLASIQYLLCGLPVVTVPSRGGRDDFFDEKNSITVAPDAEAVAAGVRTLIERRIDPWVIRAKALSLMAEHQARLVVLVDEFQRAHGVPEERLLSNERSTRMKNGFEDVLG